MIFTHTGLKTTKHFSVEFQNDRGIVLAALSNNTGAIRFASENLRNNKEIILASLN